MMKEESVMMKLLVSALWAAGGVFAASNGSVVAVLVVIAYLVYLWVLDGRWLIY